MINKINILIPMGGKSLRFQKKGISMPKPLIDVDGKPIIDRVIDSIKIDGRFIYVHRKEYVDNYSIDEIIQKKKSGIHCILNQDNRGQVETCLEAINQIDNEDPLLIVNCDNYLVWNETTINDLIYNKDIDGAAFTFTDKNKKSHWCFAEVDSNDNITRLVEKQPISDIALAGAFFWKHGSMFVKYAKKLIEKNLTAGNGEFYLGSVFNLAIQDGKKILSHKIDDMKSLGTPEELSLFHKWFNDKLRRDVNMINRNMQNAIDELKLGKPIVLVDEHDRENEGDIVIAAEAANYENIVFTINKARGLMCIPCDGEILDKLQIPLMVSNNTDRNQTPFTVSVDASCSKVSTGMSVHDRLETISVFTSDNSKPEDLNRPGHLFPLRPRPGLLKERRGHTEGSIELMKLAGLKPIAIICEIMNDDGTMAKGGQVNKFAIENGLTLISIEEIYETVYGESL